MALAPQCLLVAGALLLLAVPAHATPPADAFCVILIEPAADFNTVVYTVDETANLTERQALWPHVDLDLDGNITPAEKEQFRQANIREWVYERGLGLKMIALQPGDGGVIRPKDATTSRQIGHSFHHRSYTLPENLTEVADLETQEVRTFRLEMPADLTRVVVHGGTDLDAPTTTPNPNPPTVAIEYVVINAPDGWMIESYDGRSYSGPIHATVNSPSADVPAFDTKVPYTITFAKSMLDPPAPAPSPGAGVLFLLGLVGAAAVARRGHA